MRKVLGALVLLVLSSAALSQSVTVQIMTDSPAPADFGSSYPLGQLSNTSYVYGASFIIRVSYADAGDNALSLALSGSQSNYELTWRIAGSSDNHPFSSNLGATVTGLNGSSSEDLYYHDSGSLRTLSIEATRYKIGAKATPNASEDLTLQVTLTVTLA